MTKTTMDTPTSATTKKMTIVIIQSRTSASRVNAFLLYSNHLIDKRNGVKTLVE